MERHTLLWTLVLFFGASLVFGSIQNATEDQSTLVTLGLEVLALAVIVGALVFFVRRRKSD